MGVPDLGCDPPAGAGVPGGQAADRVPADRRHHARLAVLGGIVAYWVEAGAALTGSTATSGRPVYDAKKLAILATTPNELIADAPAWDSFTRAAIGPRGLLRHSLRELCPGLGNPVVAAARAVPAAARLR